MSSEPTTVDCPACGQEFDPSSMGGWCTNPECGEYQWTSDSANDETDSSEAASGTGTVGGDSTHDEVTCPSCSETVPDENFCKNCGAEIGSVDGVDEDDTTDGAETEANSNPSGSQPASENESTPGNADSSDASTRDAAADDIGDEPAAESVTLDTCPDCGEDVQPQFELCPFCGENLEQHRSEGGQVDEEEDSDDQAVTSAEDTPPEQVILQVNDMELEAHDGDALGRKVRTAHVRASGDDTEAQYIHREHVRFERENGEFHVKNEGRNGTKLNGEELAYEERRPVTEGDEIEFAEVATGVVHLR